MKKLLTMCALVVVCNVRGGKVEDQLFEAIKNNDLKKFGSLINEVTNIDARNNDDYSFLDLAVSKDNLAMVQALVAHGALVTKVGDASKTTALHFARSKQVAQYLVKCGAVVEHQNIIGQRPIHHAVYFGFTDVLKYLVEECQVDIEAQNIADLRPVHFACEGGRSECLKFLINLGAEIDVPTISGWRPLHFAACNNYKKCVQFLLDNLDQASIDVYTKSGKHMILQKNTPLMLAVKKSHFDVGRLLVKYGASIDKLDPTNEQHAEFLATLHQDKFFDAVEKKADATTLDELLAKHQTRISACIKDGQTLLHVAAGLACKPTCEWLLNHGSFINALTNDKQTPLHKAVSAGTVDAGDAYNVVCLLLGRFASIKQEDDNGRTPLHLAADNQLWGMADLMIERDPKVLEIRDNNEQTPVDIAIARGYTPGKYSLLDAHVKKLQENDNKNKQVSNSDNSNDQASNSYEKHVKNISSNRRRRDKCIMM